MASLREVKDRIGSVKSTLKITSAMKLVASSKLRKSQKAIETMLPYRQTLSEILSRCPSSGVSLKPAEGASKIAVVAIASNSSLCGGFNANAIKTALSALKGKDADVYAVGRRMSDSMKKAGYPQSEDYSDLVAHPSYESSAALADVLCKKFADGVYSEVLLVYNHFVSTSKQVPVAETFLPVEMSATELDGADDALIFEPSAEEIVATLLPQVQRLKLYSAILDSSAAENAARTVAMQTASDNAEDLITQLTLEYNKGRQQKITAEILDLVGGKAE